MLNRFSSAIKYWKSAASDFCFSALSAKLSDLVYYCNTHDYIYKSRVVFSL